MRGLRIVFLAVLALVAGLLMPISTASADTGVFSPAANSDDAEQRPSSVDISSSDLELVTDGSYAQTVGIRFTGVSIPAGATVTDAYIQFTSDENTTAATSLTVHGVDVSNPDTFTTAADNISKRARTAASVPWTPPGWPSAGQAGTAQRTPNLAPIVQEIVNRTSWVSGNPMALLIDGTGRRTAKAFEQGAATAPKLNVTWTTGTPPPPPVNQAPTVSAGPDQTVTLPASANLDGTVSDDGQPAGSSVTQSWSKVSGPGTVTFGSPNAADTTASFGTAGTYVLRLTGSDGALTTSDDVQVTVNPVPPPTNQSPSVSAGPDRTVTLPSSASLDGTVSDDGLPSGSSVSQTWSKVSGPGTVTFGNANAVDTTASFSAAGSYVLRLTASDGALSSSDDMAVTVNAAPTPPPGPVFPACPSTEVRPFPSGTTLSSQYKVDSPGNTTYEFDGVTSTAYPAGSASPFAFGNGTPPTNFCMNDGRVNGTTDDSLGWSYYHSNHNAPCVRIVASGNQQINRVRCNDIEDGLRPREATANANTSTFYSSGVWLDRIRDDCVENDHVIGGIIHDSLYERCNSGISERPSSSDGTFTSPSSETLTVSNTLIGLWETWHEADNDMGHNAIFKWSSSGNKLVIQCSTFYVPEMSLNGADSMEIPPGTVVDDSACPNDPTTIVWGGGGSYPGALNGTGIRVISDVSYWNGKVAAWKAAHGY